MTAVAEPLKSSRVDIRNRPVVLFGAGRMGQHVLAMFRKMGIEPVAFADNNKDLWNKEVCGVSVAPPSVLAGHNGPHFANTLFVVTVYTNKLVIYQLEEMGADFITFSQLAGQYPDDFLPYFALDRPEKLNKCRNETYACGSLWSDLQSCEEYRNQFAFRLLTGHNQIPHDDPKDIYFPDFIRPLADEIFVDCGAYDGDTVREFLKRRKGKKIIAIEPDAQNYKKLERFLFGPQNIHLLDTEFVALPFALGSVRGTMPFNATGTAGSSLGLSEDLVSITTLDHLLQDESPTFIKMDIEGAELDALRGAEQTIRRCKPVLAACLYHRPADLWQIPLFVHSICPDYNFFLRRYSDECWEEVFYAVPKDRTQGE